MIIHECVQGTTEWLQLRSGIPTASNFEKILTKSGKKSASQERYMFALLAERMMVERLRRLEGAEIAGLGKPQAESRPEMPLRHRVPFVARA